MQPSGSASRSEETIPCLFIAWPHPCMSSKRWPMASVWEQPTVALLRCGCLVCATAWCWSRAGFRDCNSEHFSCQAHPRRLPSIAKMMTYSNVGLYAAYSNARDATKSASCTRLTVFVHRATNITNPLLPTHGLKNAGRSSGEKFVQASHKAAHNDQAKVMNKGSLPTIGPKLGALHMQFRQQCDRRLQHVAK